MPLTRSEAQDALHDITKAEQQSSNAYVYQMASPHLIVWGVVWMIGYGATYAKPEWSQVWPVLVLLGVAASFWIGWRTKNESPSRYDWRYGATLIAIALFIAALFAIMPPRNGDQISAFFPLLAALLYSIIGIWTRGMRIIVAGVAITSLTLGGYFWLADYFMLWMAVVGGGALVLGGLWLRSV